MTERLNLMREVAGWKWLNKAEIEDRAREDLLLVRARSSAKDMGMEPDSIARVLSIHFDMAKAIQRYWHERWRLRGFPQDWDLANLNNELRPRLSALSDRMIVLIYLHLDELTAASGQVWPQMHGLNQFPIEPGLVLQLERALRAIDPLSMHQAGILKRVRASGILRVGSTGDYPPFTLYQDGKWSGVDIDMVQEFASLLRAELLIVPTSWPTLLQDLQLGKFDIAVGGISITAERRRHGYFSDPYHRGGKQAIGRCIDRGLFKTLKEIDQAGVRVVVNPGGSNERFVRENIRHAEVRVHPDNLTVFDVLKRGEVDLMITDAIEVRWQSSLSKELCSLSDQLLSRASKAYLVPKDKDFLSEVNIWLEQMQRSGQLDKVLQDLEPVSEH